MNKRQRRIDALANSVLVYAINTFTKEFPDNTDEDFEFFYACICKQVGLDLFRWRVEDGDTERKWILKMKLSEISDNSVNLTVNR